MVKNKIGTIFLASVIALAGIGISYSGFNDIISIFGTIETATVTLEVEDYSGTWVYKVWGPNAPAGEIYIFRGFVSEYNHESIIGYWDGQGCNAEIISSAHAEEHVGDDYDIKVICNNLFPCLDFTADFIFHYTGTIPVKIMDFTFNWLNGYDFTQYWSWQAYRVYWDVIEEVWDIDWDDPVDVGYQLHNCNYVYVELTIHLPQSNDLQGLYGEFGGDIKVIQWTDEYTPPINYPPIADAGGPYSEYVGNTIAFDGSGSYDKDGTIVLYEWDFDGDGIYDSISTTTSIAYFTYYTSDIFTVKLRVTDNNGATDTDWTTATIIPVIQIDAYVDDDFNENTHGWQVTHFDKIQDAIDSITHSTIFVYSGTYYENLVVDKSLNLIGEDKNTTIIDGGGNGYTVHISADSVSISGFTIKSGLIGIFVNSNKNFISDNKILSNDGCGICFWFSSNNVILENVISLTNKNYGVYLYFSKNNELSRNTISMNNGKGILLQGFCNENSISGNIITNNTKIGIDIFLCDNNNISDNIISYNKEGIYLDSSEGNNIFDNNISNNDKGVFINFNEFGSSNNNHIYHNNFDNNQNAYDPYTNTWDNGYPSGGNFWDDYTGFDADGDGIGDTPYKIPGGSNQDLYPFYDNSPFYFIHITDPHVKSWDSARWVQNIENIRTMTPPPDFVLCSGDLVEFGMGIGGWINFDALIEPLYKKEGIFYVDSNYKIPIYFCPGNHDARISFLFNHYYEKIGPDYYMVLHKNCAIFSMNSGVDVLPGAYGDLMIPEGDGLDNKYSNEVNKLISDLDDLDGVENGVDTSPYLKIIMMHHPYKGYYVDYEGYVDGAFINNRDTFINTCNNFMVELLICGHLHTNWVSDIGPYTKQVITGDIKEKNAYRKVYIYPESDSFVINDADYF